MTSVNDLTSHWNAKGPINKAKAIADVETLLSLIHDGDILARLTRRSSGKATGRTLYCNCWYEQAPTYPGYCQKE